MSITSSRRRRVRRRTTEETKKADMRLTAFFGPSTPSVTAKKEEVKEERRVPEIGVSSQPRIFRIDPTFGIPCEICGKSASYMIKVGTEEHYFCEDDIEKGKEKYLGEAA